MHSSFGVHRDLIEWLKEVTNAFEKVPLRRLKNVIFQLDFTRLIPPGPLHPIQNCQSTSWFSDPNWTDCQLSDLKLDYQLLQPTVSTVS